MGQIAWLAGSLSKQTSIVVGMTCLAGVTLLICSSTMAIAQTSSSAPSRSAIEVDFARSVCAADANRVTTVGGKSNIIVILADDMGFSDLGCYGGEIQTPNLDRLAANGVRFSQFYNCALCGPSRASLMTGLYPHQVGMLHWTGLLNNRCVTAFELFKRANYQTCAVGRLDMVTAEDWHDPANIAHYADHFFGTTGHKGPGNYFKAVRDCPFYLDGKPFALPENTYKTDLFTDVAVKFITDAAAKDRPFFLYLAYSAPHWPLHAKPDDMAKYRQLYQKLGWDEARKARYQRQVAMGLFDGKCGLASRDSRVPAWTEATNKAWEADRMAAYAAQIDVLDQGVGRVLQALKNTHADRNTLVLFLSDNGSSDQSGPATLDKPGHTWRLDGTRTQFGNKPGNQPGLADTFVTAGPAWAQVANTPFRGCKDSNFEGGIAAPLIAWWPGVIHHAGVITPEVSHISDIMATSFDVAGIEYPSEFHGRSVLPIAGKSLLPVLLGSQREGHKSVCWATTGCRAIREGMWKLVAAKNGPWELYNMKTDRTEQHDLAAGESERVKEMAAKWQAWAKAAPNPERGGRQQTMRR